MSAILRLAHDKNIWVIEDAAQSLGSLYQGKYTSTLGSMGCLSFYPTKNLGACGDAGAVICETKKLSDRIKKLRNHGENKRYHYEQISGNFRLDALQACILSSKLPKLFEKNNQRRFLAQNYIKHLPKNPLIQFQATDLSQNFKGNSLHVYQQFVISTRKKNKVKKSFMENNIGFGEYYPWPLHLQPAVKHLGYKRGDFPVAENLAKTSIALPIYPELPKQHQEKIIEVLWKNLKF